MADPNIYRDDPPVGSTYAGPLPAGTEPMATPQHTAAEEEYLNDLYTSLKPLAVEMYVGYFLARTPAHLQEDMKDLVRADLAVPPTPPASLDSRRDPPRDPPRA